MKATAMGFGKDERNIDSNRKWLQQEQDEHGHGKWEGKQKGKRAKRITESKAQQKESTTLCTNIAY
jgi:hypothetical protein